jgi:alpha-ketoglutarate-dependent taurine dioxygenase
MKEVITSMRMEKSALPLRMIFDKEITLAEFADWYKGNGQEMRAQLHRYGALVFEGLPIASVEDFEQLTGSLSSKFRNYVDGSYPRKRLSKHVYISTEYDCNFQITQHNELSYSVKWPELLYFGCVIPPGQGGETPLADSRRILDRLNPDLLAEFERKQVRYVRNLHNGEGMGPSWQETFETDDRRATEQYCREAEIEYSWKENGDLKLVHIRPATRMHPVTGEKVWFNQADQYHPSHFRAEIYDTLMILAGGIKEDLPLFASFGDGSEITDEMITELRKTINEGIYLRPWRQGDFVVVDNMLVCHGRMPYSGDRQIVVSMA